MNNAFSLKVQRKVNKGWNKESRKLGQKFDIVRTGTVSLADQLYRLKHWNRRLHMEMITSLFIYRVVGDCTKLVNGDQLVGKDAQGTLEQDATLERYTIVAHRLLQPVMAVRTDVKAQIYRPTQPAGNYNFVDTCNMPQAAYNKTTHQWEWTSQATLAASPTNYIGDVWIGLFPRGPSDFNPGFNLPLSTNTSGWWMQLGLLPGINLRDGDEIVDNFGDRYRISRAYQQPDSAVMYQCQLDKMKI